jgi:hypothetical protein
MRHTLKLLSVALIAGLAFGSTVGCKAGRVHELNKTVTTYAPDGSVAAVDEMDFESGISAWNMKVNLNEIEFNESLGDGKVWSSSGSADSAAGSPETRLFQTLETLGAIYRNVPIQQPQDDLANRLTRIESILANQANDSEDDGPDRADQPGTIAAIPSSDGEPPNVVILTPEQLAQLNYLNSLRDSPPAPPGDSQ